MNPDLTAFFDAYGKAFTEGPAAIASFYFEPCITARMGVVRANLSRADTTALFAAVDKQYRERGFTHGDYVVLDWRTLGANSAIATLRWAYRNAKNETIWQMTFTYNLYRQDGAWKIVLQTMHDE